MKEKALEEADAEAINTIPIGVDEDGEPIVVRNGRYGPYVKRGEDTASVPEDLPLDELAVERAVEMLSAPKGGEPLGTDPATGLAVFAKSGRFGPYVQLGDADTLPPEDEAADVVAVPDDGPVDDHARRRPPAPARCPASSASTPRAARSSRQRALRAVPHVGRGDAQHRRRGEAAHHRRRRGGLRSSPSPSSSAAARPHRCRRSASSAPTRCRASRSW